MLNPNKSNSKLHILSNNFKTMFMSNCLCNANSGLTYATQRGVLKGPT